MELAFYFSALALAVLTFSLKITAPSATTQFLLSGINKLVSIFVILYSALQIFKYFGAV